MTKEEMEREAHLHYGITTVVVPDNSSMVKDTNVSTSYAHSSLVQDMYEFGGSDFYNDSV